MKKFIFLMLLCLARIGLAASGDDTVDLRYYPPDPESVDVKQLPNLVKGLAPGMTFLNARKLIIKNGWKPLNLKKHWPADEEPDCELLDCVLHRHGIIELEGCPTDKPVCVFYYRRGKSWLQLMATGEAMNELFVYYWAGQSPRNH